RLTIPAGRSEALFWDSDLRGFGVRLLASGVRTWVVQYRTDSGQRRQRIGPAATLNAEEARKAAKKILAKVQLGHDPVAEKRERSARAAETFGVMAERFLTRQKARLKPRSYLEVERHLTGHAKPLHGVPLSKIDRRMLAGLLAGIAEGGPVAA